jgi:hypothetical protein
MGCLDADWFAGFSWEVGDVEGDDQLDGREHVPVLERVGHRGLEPLDLCAVDLGFFERGAHRRLEPCGCSSVSRRSTRLRRVLSRMRALQSGAYSSSSASRSSVSRSEKG